MTWGECKTATLQKMFTSEDEGAEDYLAAMPQAANEAIQMIATTDAGKHIRSHDTLTKDPAQSRTFDLEDELIDFLNVGDFETYCMDGDEPRPVSLKLLGGHLLVAPKGIESVLVYYNAKPARITENTPDTQEIDLPEDAAALVPMYMASQLYKDDDLAIATTYRNEFETAFERLQNRQAENIDTEFTSESGWW